MVPCKTIEYELSKEKIRKFCLEEALINAARNQHSDQGTSSSSAWTHDKMKKKKQTCKSNKSNDHPKGRQFRQLHPNAPQRQRNSISLQSKHSHSLIWRKKVKALPSFNIRL